MGKKKLIRAYLLAVMWCVIAMTVLISSTYAWFTLQAVATITPMRGTVGTADGTLLISNQPNTGFDVSCELIPDEGFQELKPLTTDDLRDFYRLDFYDSAHQSYHYLSATDRFRTDALHGYLYLKSEDSSFDVYLHPEQFLVTAPEQVLAALRIGFRIQSREGIQTHIYKADYFRSTRDETGLQMVQDTTIGGNVVAGLTAEGLPVYLIDPAVEVTDYLAAWTPEQTGFQPGFHTFCHVAQDEIATVEYFIYVEGCDVHCVNELQAQGLEVQFGFAGVPIKTDSGGEE